jgi:hypothetical protein
MTFDPVSKTWSYPAVTLLGNPVPSGYTTFVTLQHLGNGWAETQYRLVPTRATLQPGGWWLVSVEA